MILFCASAVLAIFSLVEIIFKNKNEKLCRVLPALALGTLFLLYILADFEIFTDSKNYIEFFNIVKFDKSLQEFEIGWGILNIIVKFLFDDYWFLMFVFSIIVCTAYYFSIKQISPYPTCSIFLLLTLGFWGMGGTVMRQGASMAISLCSLKYIFEKKPIKFYLMILLATLFHYSGIMFVILYPVSKLKIDKKYFIGLSIIMLLTILFGGQMLGLVNKIFHKYYRVYKNSSVLLILGIIVVSVTETIYVRKFHNDDEKMKLLCHMTLLASILTTMSIYNYSFIRLSYYFLACQILLIPIIISKFEYKNRPYLLSIVILSAIFFYSVIIEFNSGAMLPYKFFW